MSGNGYVKIFRSILEWEHYSDAPTSRVFLHLLVSANFASSNICKAGELITSRRKIASELKLHRSTIRTSLDKLAVSKDIEISNFGIGLKIKIENYTSYQSGKVGQKCTNKDIQVGQKCTNGGSEMYQPMSRNVPKVGQKPPHNKNIIINKNIKNVGSDFCDDVIKFFNATTNKKYKLNDTRRKRITALLKEYSIEEIKSVIVHKNKDWANNLKMRKFVTPDTLFRSSNFDNYLNEPHENYSDTSNLKQKQGIEQLTTSIEAKDMSEKQKTILGQFWE